jgi:hypothetical protein
MLGAQRVAVSPEDADAAFRSLYAEHGPALLRLSTVLTEGDRHRAEDMVQETMLRAWTHRANLDIQPGKPAPQKPNWTTTLRSPAASSPTPASTRLASAPQSPPCPVCSARY